MRGTARVILGRKHGLVLVALVPLLVLGASAGSLAGHSLLSPHSAGGPPPLAPPPIKHVILVMMENHAFYQVLGGAPYMHYLFSTYAGATHYYAMCHPSVPNYLAETSGNTHQCGTDNYTTYNGTNIGDLLHHAGLSWRAYLQQMPVPCDTGTTTLYNVHHNPMVYYRDVVSNASLCDSHDVGASQFNASFAAGQLPSLSIYTPNMNNDCHNTALSYCDGALKGLLTPILNTTNHLERKELNSTALFVVFDESQSNDTSGYALAAGGHVYFVAISPWSKGIVDTTDGCPYTLLSTIEWIFHLPSTGGHDGTKAYPAMKALFT